MLNWQAIPFVRLLLPFIGGTVWAAQGWADHWATWIAPSLLATAFGSLFLLSRRRLAYKFRWLSGLVVMMVSFWLAISCWQLQQPERQPRHYVQLSDQQQYYLFRIEAIQASRSGKQNRLELAILGYGKQPDSLCRVSGRTFCYLPADFLFSVGQYGIAAGQFQLVRAPNYPSSFNFAEFMAQQGMVRQLALCTQEIYLLDYQPVSAPLSRIKAWSARLQQRLFRLLPNRSASLVSALVLGQKAQLDAAIRDDYASVGAMHVLAVSGMHVGIVALGLEWLLAWGRRPRPFWKALRAVLVVGGIWLFALLAGAGPPVLRAATMFSLFSIGRLLYLPKNVWNILAATALLMLCLDTRALFSVGFQLSYTAVAAIVYFQPRISQVWALPKGPLDYLWQLFSLGLAAQLGTAAISIHYFHQFPLYFWLSGLIIVPLASLALWLGLAVLLLGELPLLGSLLAHGLDQLVLLMNQTMGWIAELPASSITPLYLSANATLLLAGLLVGSVLYYHHRSRTLAWMLIGGAALLLWQQNRLMQQNGQQQEYLVHTARSGIGITLVQGQTARTLASDSSLLIDIAYAKNNYLLQKNVRHNEVTILPAGSYLLQWNRQTFVWLRAAIDSCQLLNHSPNLVLIDSPFLESQLAILQQWQPDAVVVSPALPYREQKNWQVALGQSGILLANTTGQHTYYHPIKP